ncbi:FliH/SctL family protein [Marinilactibacillus sp. Marseille-P9653]|uniref:FliH/SctL family protein n=1 Tax=Marinilactibacillus sp. Marseille-P9653 TaxID=2866583 RepID=UPI001CE431A2|nr:FliH/SctL family protein [Marinilactibacillus sp. Marseille-P9653]
MLSSSRIIKSKHNIQQAEDAWVIDTVLTDTDEYTEEESDTSEETQEVLLEKKRILNHAYSKKEELLEQAKQEAEAIKQQAYQTAFQQGQEAGYQEGYTLGMKEGFEQGKRESEALKQEGRDLIVQAQLEVEQYSQDKKEELLKLAVHMAEKIVHEQINHNDEGILSLIHPILHQLDREEDFISITVNPAVRNQIQANLASLKNQYTGVRFAVLQDSSIEPIGCIVESAHKVIDLQITAQLESMLKEMKETERNV